MRIPGTFVKNLSGEAEYFSFKPIGLPLDFSLNITDEVREKIIFLHRELAHLDEASKLIPNVNLFISMYVRKEALVSSQIEGTQCTLDDIFDESQERNADIDVQDVINYISAISFAIKRMNEMPLCNRLFKEIHKELLEGVRGDEKYPGEFRKSQNWIGGVGCGIKDARYIPPNVFDMENAMNNLEKYINDGKDYDPLIRIALIHYQFETIHPFLDGNGRIGRMLIILFLIKQKILRCPVIYVSYFLKKNQIEYYDRMSEVRKSGNYEQWISFFIDAISGSATDSLESIEKLFQIREKNLSRLPKTNRAKDNVRLVFDYVEQHPIVEIKRMAKNLSISFNTASSAVEKLVDLNILQKRTNASRNRVFSYEEYLKILRKGTE